MQGTRKPRFSIEMERALMARWRSNPDDPPVKKELAERYMGLIESVARSFVNQCTSLEHGDLVTEGYIFFIEQILPAHDETRGGRLSTLLVTGLKRHFLRIINRHDPTIYLPYLQRQSAKAWLEAGGTEESAHLLGPYGPQIMACFSPLEADAPVTNESGDITHLFDLIADGQPSVEMQVEERETKRQLADRIELLSDKERSILEGRYGLKDGQVKKLRELGEEHNMSREGIRHVQTRAEKNLAGHIGNSFFVD